MRLPDFKVEQWMNDYENDAIYNMTDTCVKSLTLQELLDLEDFDFSNLILDYGQITGDIELKKEILSLYEHGTIDNITTAQGCLQANELVMNTLLEKGDEVISVVPGYQQFVDVPKSLGCKVHLVELDEWDWQVSVEKFRGVLNSSTKMIILNNPSNPTGTEYSNEFLNALIELCKPYNTYILCDEVYRGLNEEVSISDIYENGIAVAKDLERFREGLVIGNLDRVALVSFIDRILIYDDFRVEIVFKYRQEMEKVAGLYDVANEKDAEPVYTMVDGLPVLELKEAV